MITKNQTKELYYLDRDTDIDDLVDRMIRMKRAEAIVFLKARQEQLQHKDAGEYYTIEDTTKLKDGELEKMMRFFRGAVMPYYVRQSRNIWTEKLDPAIAADCTDEIKRSIGFMRYDHTGHQTDDVNSLATFERIKDFTEFLTQVQEVCFDDDGYIFPDSESFRKNEKTKGRDAAHRQAYLELKEKVKNKHYKRDLI